jgi:hypothetical protein
VRPGRSHRDFKCDFHTDDSLRVAESIRPAETHRAIHGAQAQRIGKFFLGVAGARLPLPSARMFDPAAVNNARRHSIHRQLM